MPIRRILFPTDFSEHAERALPHALWLAEEFGAELHMLHAVVLHADDPANPDRAFPDLDEAYGQLRRWAADRMDDVASGVGRGGDVEVVKAQERGIAAAPTIVEYADDHDVDVIAMATHGRRGVRRMLLGSVAEEVLRTAGCPVLTVRPDDGLEPGRVERILVPVDFSEHADLALASAGVLARRLGARLDVLHVIAEPSYPDPYFAEAAALRGLAEAAHDRVPEALAERVEGVLEGDLAVETHMEVGSPAGAISDFAREQDSDLIVVGSHGRTGVERVFLGSVAEGVVRRAPCPVLTVKPFGKTLAEDRA